MNASFSHRFYPKIILPALTALAVFLWFAYGGTGMAQEKAKTTTILDPADPSSILYLDTSGKLAGTGDPTKPPSQFYRVGMGWHPQALTDTRLPKDKYGLIDWAKLVKTNMIKPRWSLDPNEEEMPPLDLDIIISSKSDFVNDVKYPHWIHTWWLKCEVCHPKIFVPAKGQNNMFMTGIAEGQWCGRCHGKIAFPLGDCNRCHTVPKGAAK